MIDRIIDILGKHNIQNFLINENITETQELFYIKKSLNLTRNKNVSKYEITLYRDFIENNVNMRGSASCMLNNSMSDDELSLNILSTYESALSVHNPYYKLPHGEAMFTDDDSISIRDYSINIDNLSSSLPAGSSSLSLNELVTSLFENDTKEASDNCFINSAEIFVTSSKNRIINSNGVNVSYSDKVYSGEFVVQCTSPVDVELYQDFKYSSDDKNISDSLKSKVSDALTMVKDRSAAIAYSSDMQYDKIILEGPCLYELFNYYLQRLNAVMIYPKYSSFEIGKSILNNVSNYVNSELSDNSTVFPDEINITLTPKKPYSTEGISLKNLELIKNNIVQYIIGNARFSFYLGINPTGEYDSYKLKHGNSSLKDMKSGKYLRIVNFSDFQMDSFTGQIGGEYRLAYYHDGTKEIPITNGSISFNINDILKTIKLSSDIQSSYNYEGPLAISFMV